MQEPAKVTPQHLGDFAAMYPGLTGLGLAAEELDQLRHQGYLERRKAQRNPGGGYWRLRYRRAGALKTIYVGSDHQRANQIRSELHELQAARRDLLETRRADRQSTNVIRQAKQQLAPVLLHLGLHYHGDAIRKRRTPKT